MTTPSASPHVSGTGIHDHALYYDVLFSWDRAQEAAFYDALFRHHGVSPQNSTGKVLEVACGPGTLSCELARLGWRPIGLDLNPKMLALMEQHARRAGVAVSTLHADMTDFLLPEPAAVAFCPMISLTILPTGDAVIRHLRSTADNLAPGGLYAIAMWFCPDYLQDLPHPVLEGWSGERDGIRVEARTDGKLIVTDPTRPAPLELSWGGRTRFYSTQALADLVLDSGRFDILAWYPQVSRDQHDASTYSITHTATPPLTGHGVVLLRRKG